MDFNQTVKVITKDNEIKEYKEGFIGAYHLIAYECVCEHTDENDCDEDECYNELELMLSVFFDKYKKFIGICINNESKDHLNIILDYIDEMDKNLENYDILLELKNIDGIEYTIDLDEDTDKDTLENLDSNFLKVFEKEKGNLVKNHIEEFGEYYLEIMNKPFVKISSKVYDFSDEIGLLADILNRPITKDEVNYICKELKNIVLGYLTHIQLGY